MTGNSELEIMNTALAALSGRSRIIGWLAATQFLTPPSVKRIHHRLFQAAHSGYLVVVNQSQDSDKPSWWFFEGEALKKRPLDWDAGKEVTPNRLLSTKVLDKLARITNACEGRQLVFKEAMEAPRI